MRIDLTAALASRTPDRQPDRVVDLALDRWTGVGIPPLNANQRWGPRDHRLTGIKRDLRRAVVRACRSVALPTGAEFVEVTLWYRPRSGKGPDPSNLMPTVKVVTDALLPQPTVNRSRTYTAPPAGYGLIEDDDRTRVSQVEPIVLSSSQALPGWGVELRVWYPSTAEARPHDPFGPACP